MPDDRRKMLETLAAKRKAEAQAPTRHAKPKVPSLPSKPVVKSGGEKPKIKPSSFSLKETPKKKKRVEKYESEGSDEEERDSLSSESDAASGDDSDVEIIKKPVKNVAPPSKGKVPMKHEAKGSKLVRPGVDAKGREDAKGKSGITEKVKGRKKAGDSSDEGVSDEDDGGDLSNASGDEVDPGNILPGRTRRVATQPLQYDFGNASDEDDDSDE